MLDAQAAATVALFIVSIGVLLQSARPLNGIRIAIVGAMVIAFIGVLALPSLAHFFALELQWQASTVWALVLGVAGAACVWAAALVTDRWRRP